MAFISRNPFAREELHRESVKTTESCNWCGNRRKSGKLFRYYINPDSLYNRRNTIKGLFCCIGCMRAYHNQ